MRRGRRLRAGGAGGRRRAATAPPTLRDRVEDLQEEVESLTEDIEDLGEPVEEFDLFDQCAYTIGVTQYGSWGGDTGFLFGPGGTHAPAGARDGHARLRHAAVRLPRLPRRGATRASSATRMPARNSSTTERLVGRLVPAVGVIALCAAALAAAPGDTSGITPDSARLPDLDQELPWDLQVTSTGPGTRREYRLGFASAVRNIGDGPLIVSGRREWAAIPTMTADQLIESATHRWRCRAGRPAALRPLPRPRALAPAGLRALRAAPAPEGRRASDRSQDGLLPRRPLPHRSRALPAQPPAPRYTSRCGLGATARLGLLEGISVGYGDDYAANLEGQSLPLTGLAAGRYVLIHRVNVRRRLRETDYGNNASSLLLRLRWRAGEPRIRVLRRCPDTEHCD